MPDVEQTLTFSVAGPLEGEVSELHVAWTRAGEPRMVRLTDDGSHPADVPWDGVWSGVDVGVPVRDVAGRLLITDLEGAEHANAMGIVPVYDVRAAELTWQLVRVEGGYQTRWVAAALPGESLLLPEAAAIYTYAAWSGLCFVVVAALVHVTRRQGVGW